LKKINLLLKSFFINLSLILFFSLLDGEEPFFDLEHGRQW